MLSISANIEDSDVYNVSSSRAISLNSLIKLFKEETKTNFEIVYVPSRLNDNSISRSKFWILDFGFWIFNCFKV